MKSLKRTENKALLDVIEKTLGEDVECYVRNDATGQGWMVSKKNESFTQQPDFLSDGGLEDKTADLLNSILAIKTPAITQNNEWSEMVGIVRKLEISQGVLRGLTGPERLIRFKGEYQPLFTASFCHSIDISSHLRDGQAERASINMTLDDERIKQCVRLSEVAKNHPEWFRQLGQQAMNLDIKE